MSVRKKIAAAAVLLLVVSLAAYGTLAYLVGQGTAHNIITSGNVTIDLRDGYPTGIKVMPGETLESSVTVVKTGDSAPCWVRVRPMQAMRLAGAAEDLPAEEYGDKVTLTFSGDARWIYSGGWYYYRDILTDSAPTANLLEKVEFDGPGMGNEYQGASFTLRFEAQAVQSDNNTPAGGVLSVAGWPAE